MKTNHRRFLRTVAGTAFALPLAAADTGRRKFTLGIIADVHKDIIHDADKRLATFVDEMKKVRAVLEAARTRGGRPREHLAEDPRPQRKPPLLSHHRRLGMLKAA